MSNSPDSLYVLDIVVNAADAASARSDLGGQEDRKAEDWSSEVVM